MFLVQVVHIVWCRKSGVGGVNLNARVFLENLHKIEVALTPCCSYAYIREYGSTLYVGLARAVSPTNTSFRLTFLLT